jgi:hypothetical protein
MSNRTFKLTSPLMQGPDVAHFQETLNERFHNWHVGFYLDVDGAYGTLTRAATERAMYGLGIALAELEHGVSPQLRIKLRHPEGRTHAERLRANQRRDWLRRLQRRFDGHGPAAAIAYARKYRNMTESPPGSNRGAKIDQWQRMCGIIAQPWCGCFVNACLVAAGFPTQEWLRYCPSIEAKARSGDARWSWHSIQDARPGDLVLYGRTTAEHVELYAGAGVTYGGNTSSDNGGSQANGGGVFERRRNFGAPGFPARGVARPPYPGR